MDFVKYYPNVIERDVCALIVEELKEVTPLEGATGSTRINGLDCISLKIDSDNFTFPLLAKAIKKIKANYIDEYPRYKNFLNYSSGEFYEVFEDIGSKLLIQHYPENGFMKEHIDNTSQRNYIRANKTINLEHRHSQLTIIIMMAANLLFPKNLSKEKQELQSFIQHLLCIHIKLMLLKMVNDGLVQHG